MKSISQGTDLRLKQLTNNTDDFVPRNNNMEIQLVQWFTLTGRNCLQYILQRWYVVTNRTNVSMFTHSLQSTPVVLNWCRVIGL
jgi:hypothetical protein